MLRVSTWQKFQPPAIPVRTRRLAFLMRMNRTTKKLFRFMLSPSRTIS